MHGLTSFNLAGEILSVLMGSLADTSSNMTSGMAIAHTICAQRPWVVGFRAPPRRLHRQHSYQIKDESFEQVLMSQIGEVFTTTGNLSDEVPIQYM